MSDGATGLAAVGLVFLLAAGALWGKSSEGALHAVPLGLGVLFVLAGGALLWRENKPRKG